MRKRAPTKQAKTKQKTHTQKSKQKLDSRHSLEKYLPLNFLNLVLLVAQLCATDYITHRKLVRI